MKPVTRKRWLVGASVLFAAAVLAAFTLPWWFGLALKASAGRFGASFVAYERNGYTRFVLRDVQVRRANVLVSARTVEADTPLLWGWRWIRGSSSGVVKVGEWMVTVDRPQASAEPGAPRTGGWLVLRAKLWKIAAELDHWLPHAVVGPGRVRWATGEVSVRAATWQRSTLQVESLRYATLELNGTLAFNAKDDLIRLNVKDTPRGVEALLGSRGTQISGEIAHSGQRAKASARFAAVGWIPPEATLEADALRIPAGQIKLQGMYAAIIGHARLDWRIDHFFADVALRSEPLTESNAPPASVALRGRGDARAFTIDTLHAEFPGVLADLSEPVTVDRQGRLSESEARLTLRADLARQPWIAASGRVNGEARVVRGEARVPLVEFGIAADALSVRGTAISRMELNGRLTWPRLLVDRMLVRGGEGETVTGQGGWNFQDREALESSLSGTLRRATLGRWVPPKLQFESVTFQTRGSGPGANLAHTGEVAATEVRFGAPGAARIELSWRGHGARLDAFSAQAVLGRTRILASGKADPNQVRLSEFTFEHAGVPELRLKEPAVLSWRPRLSLQALHLAGQSSAIDASVTWGTTGSLGLVVRDLPSRWLSDLVSLTGRSWNIASLALTGSWSEGPMVFSAAGGITTELEKGRIAEVAVSAHGDARSIRIEALRAVDSGNTVFSASGSVPITLSPGSGTFVSIKRDGPLELKARTVPNAAFWQNVAETTGVELRAPVLIADIGGTWKAPRGNLTATAERATVDAKRLTRPLPAFEAVDVLVTADSAGIQLERFGFKVEGQIVRISGQLPVPEDAWRDVVTDPVSLAKRGAKLRVEVPGSEVSKFTRFLPAALAPVGNLQADIQIDAGSLGGFLKLRGAASRPLGPLGVLQQVSADVEFEGSQILLKQVTATSGGQPVTLTGQVVLPTRDWLAGREAKPSYDVALQGRNVPFVRQAGMLLRGDLDIELKTPDEGVPRISGKVTLRDSLFLADVRAYLPSGAAASPSRRPPYFSVDTKPLSTWALDVDIVGTRFMRVRMPVFAGVTSARFNLRGTLGDPRILGNASIDEGQVLMPFATFTVRQGIVRLTEESPFEPTIYLRGTGRHFGYDLGMEVTGKASAPHISFTSSPALDSEQVLLMVMTGASPGNEVSTSLTHRAVQIGAFFGQSVIGSLTGRAARPDRLSIETGEKISQQGRETYAIEYELADRWSVTGEYDEFDEYNVGFKWRVSPKEKER